MATEPKAHDNSGVPAWVEDDVIYDVALRVTDEVLGEGTYAELNAGNGNPRVRAAIARAAAYPGPCLCHTLPADLAALHVDPAGHHPDCPAYTPPGGSGG